MASYVGHRVIKINIGVFGISWHQADKQKHETQAIWLVEPPCTNLFGLVLLGDLKEHRKDSRKPFRKLQTYYVSSLSSSCDCFLRNKTKKPWENRNIRFGDPFIHLRKKNIVVSSLSSERSVLETQGFPRVQLAILGNGLSSSFKIPRYGEHLGDSETSLGHGRVPWVPWVHVQVSSCDWMKKHEMLHLICLS